MQALVQCCATNGTTLGHVLSQNGVVDWGGLSELSNISRAAMARGLGSSCQEHAGDILAGLAVAHQKGNPSLRHRRRSSIVR
jgi:hypothetical protein